MPRYDITSFELLKRMLSDLHDDPTLPWNSYPCLKWPRSCNEDGYGIVYVEGGDGRGAHRKSYELVYGEIVDRSLKVCHRCDNPPCVRPIHLFLGTDGDNARDSAIKGRRNRPSGAKNPKAKVSEDDVLKILKLLKDGVPGVSVAKTFGLLPLAVYRIKAGTSWGHLHPPHHPPRVEPIL